MKASAGIALLVSLLAAAPACVVATQPVDPGPGSDPSQPSGGELDPRLVGCWDWYNYRDSRTGTESYRGKLELDDDGGYAWRAYPWGSSEGKGLPEYVEQGEWDIDGGILELLGDRGTVVDRTVSFENGALHLDGIKQFTCL
ncbi:MAG: hypothetical protein ABIY55_26580 [Kofleriaceae bacterium]